ncbi:unnamed protein product [Gongylonema pulchrum]|uniref:Rubis-subs-bind domain-containing protein n=1 Tax=Gongylonema pulchrum TaxID=637853 RepID=A0A183EXK7_9BILA|nr:unnamed protein product [Gongylonema pulchrum]
MVLCPALGDTVTIDQFRHIYSNSNVQDAFKFAHLNIQDPLELSHNVSMLISEKRISSLRRQMMFALSHLKAEPDSFVSTLQISPDNNNSATSSAASSSSKSVMFFTIFSFMLRNTSLYLLAAR